MDSCLSLLMIPSLSLRTLDRIFGLLLEIRVCFVRLELLLESEVFVVGFLFYFLNMGIGRLFFAILESWLGFKL